VDRTQLFNTARTNVADLSRGNLGVPLLLLVMLAMMMLPVPPFLLDVFFTFNIALSIVVLLVCVYALRPLDFAVFPTILLVATLLRLALNVASTRVVMLHGQDGHAAAGKVIQAFGEVVIGGNYVVGIVVFAILMIINFVVVTKGAGRISEVSARFTLDAMPGKQMAIDADLNAGLIDQNQAKSRRQEVAQEAEFYGSMDGASKFVRGDAIAGLLILFINLIGGMAVGIFQHGMSFGDAGKVYALLTIGDGLVAQLPSLLLSTAAAIMVTRASGSEDMGKQINRQMFASPKALAVAAGLMAVMGLVPGMPHFSFLSMAALAAGGAYLFWKKQNVAKVVALEEVKRQQELLPSPARAMETKELGRRDADRHDRPRSRLPPDSAGRPQSGWAIARADQGCAQEALAGSGLSDADRAHPRQPRSGAERLPLDADGRDPRRGRDLPGSRTGDQSGSGVRLAQRYQRQRSGFRPGGGVDRNQPARPGAIARLHRGRCEHRGRHPLEPDSVQALQ
jgi:flagellar biosynthesis protein FlhA